MEPLHRVLKAIAEPNRLRILNLLLEEPLCVCELEFLLDLPQPLLSRHLAYLRSAGLATDRRLGMRVQYSMVKGNPVADHLRSCLGGLLETEELYRRDRARLEDWRRAGEAGHPESDGIIASQGAKS